ncbi:MAG TPA: response regulator, partial [Aggregicoccus sp.]|nr:response regulator [Aggregicoccus sp.]
SPERLAQDTSLFLGKVEQTADTRRQLPRPAVAPTLEGRRVLIVDDDIRNIFALASVLEGKGMEVITAENGRACLQVLDANPDVDAILMDVMMPEMDGYETMRAIRKDPRFGRLPIIAVTAKALKDDRERCLAAGASDYMPKPVDTDRLAELLRLWRR